MNKPLLLACAGIAAIMPTIATAQSSDVVVMRRTLAAPKPAPSPSPTPTPPATPTPTPAVAAHWQQMEDWTNVDPAQTCTQSTEQTQTVRCVLDDGSGDTDEVNCTAAKPSTTRLGQNTTSCTFSWGTGEFGNWSSECSQNAQRSRNLLCTRSDGTPGLLSSCDAKPSAWR